MKLKLLKKSITKDGDEKTRKLVYKAYAKKLKRVEKELGLKKGDRVLNDLEDYTVSQHEIGVQEMEGVPPVVPSLSEDTESMEDTTSCKNLLEQENDASDYECFNICQIS
ncbi:predicted protein [Chaetoceros tenuissimus]|uniref:Uncharacterized protein n=1 Tax=Chaetoceros tenuissimus TaxID=426638 RepID=A0AAD3DFN4_9STRA|nr:predicted protein [Chaetoceros tenuissimus]